MYWTPQTITEALQIRRDNECMVMAGGTDLYPLWGDAIHQHNICDISKIKQLHQIHIGRDSIEIGAMASWYDITQMKDCRILQCLRQAAGEVGAHNIQTRATIAGNIITASPAGDGIVALMALNANVVVESANNAPKNINLGQFITNYRQTALQPNEILTKIVIPNNTGFSAFRKLGARRYLVISIAMVAIWLECDNNGIITDARVAVGACSAVAQNLPLVVQKIIGLSMHNINKLNLNDSDLTPLKPLNDVRATAEYRLFAVKNLINDLLQDIQNDYHHQ